MSSRAIVMNSYGLVRYQKNVSIHLGREGGRFFEKCSTFENEKQFTSLEFFIAATIVFLAVDETCHCECDIDIQRFDITRIHFQFRRLLWNEAVHGMSLFIDSIEKMNFCQHLSARNDHFRSQLLDIRDINIVFLIFFNPSWWKLCSIFYFCYAFDYFYSTIVLRWKYKIFLKKIDMNVQLIVNQSKPKDLNR